MSALDSGDADLREQQRTAFRQSKLFRSWLKDLWKDPNRNDLRSRAAELGMDGNTYAEILTSVAMAKVRADDAAAWPAVSKAMAALEADLAAAWRRHRAATSDAARDAVAAEIAALTFQRSDSRLRWAACRTAHEQREGLRAAGLLVE
ncbi:MAG: hypothetical protein GXY74_05460 [Phycisphaerae bacterium]|nr:hypothetical protein [Phycisphaerae bacterium]